jgi:hypothetical protein
MVSNFNLKVTVASWASLLSFSLNHAKGFILFPIPVKQGYPINQYIKQIYPNGIKIIIGIGIINMNSIFAISIHLNIKANSHLDEAQH